jgi:hypothetical protein
MKENHIIDILNNSPLARLSENEQLTISAHLKNCDACNRAYQAAEISSLLIKEHAAEAEDNSLGLNPFFQTRVLAAWREQRAMNSISAFRRLWSASGALVASMAATTAAFAVLTFVVPSGEPASQQTAALIPNSAETVVLDQNDSEQLTEDEALSDLYADDDGGK